jgi:HAE1 family hydrophobic/amphiphilic exporter-1
MLSALTILKHLGFSMNLISMIGLIIVSGMLADDAIILVENIFRRIESGENFKTALALALGWGLMIG